MDEEIKKNIMKTGTTTVGIKFKNGVVIGADRRATFNGMFIAHKNMTKVLPITDNIIVATAGNVSDIQFLVKLIKAELRLKKLKTKKESTLKEAANLLASIAYNNIRRLSTIIAITSFLVAGRDRNGFWLYDVQPDGSTSEYTDFVSSGSGMVVAYGVLEDSYDENITKEKAIDLAVKALSAAMKRDIPTGSGIDVYVIDSKGVEKAVAEKVKEVRVKD
ncbi:proteasome subunit beta [Candidatus Pacearchaeota archaeon CG_4_9_14_3_um_filter_31_7]|nr:MAG: hypothetical protein AUJ10_01855 [Candidatus Pacearchaeota archaeon CG1_02_31_27]PIN92585.1 MAG: proteasome subunit beta [Candidatus Pacearchaeota archaeon CG10_big_fil_rev_8_21_14_0_10_31_59]PIZ80731.1 MAG: proteasome subunit beta [Candidatus Pacearchaeota archaeon CG_4_10_14_0_2_um_filter_31_10]PJA70519.1 MAG: proteasome subunit beta [Candidatus Pacearchaeota archaeon CG_4_9_14_3_um_filter_31_7]